MSQIKIIVIAFLLFLACGTTATRADDVSVIDVYNRSIQALAEDLIKSKSVYPELEGFSQSALMLDVQGAWVLDYQHLVSQKHQDPYAYQALIRFNPNNSGASDPTDLTRWVENFPLLGVQIEVQVPTKGSWVSLDIRKLLEQRLIDLRLFEQKSMPFRLELSLPQETVTVGETVKVKAQLIGAGSKAYQVTDLNENSLYCTDGRQEWGSLAGGELNRVLNPSNALENEIELFQYKQSRDVWITCTYAVAYKGIRPFNRVKLRVISPK